MTHCENLYVGESNYAQLTAIFHKPLHRIVRADKKPHVSKRGRRNKFETRYPLVKLRDIAATTTDSRACYCLKLQLVVRSYLHLLKILTPDDSR